MKNLLFATFCFVFSTNLMAQKVDTTLQEKWGGSAWGNITKTITTYNADCNASSTLIEMWNTSSGGVWNNQQLRSYTYSGTTLSGELDQKWDNVSTIWINNYRITYSYDGSSRLDTTLNENWTGSNWINSSRYVNTYDMNGNIATQLIQRWDTTSNSFLNQQLTINTYNIDGTINYFVEQIWGISDWNNNARYSYTYDSNKGVIERMIEDWNYSSAAWSNYERDTYTRNASGKELTDLAEIWQTNQWIKVLLYSSTYDGNNYLNNYLTQTWDNGSSSWVNSQQQSKSNNSDGTVHELIFQNWSTAIASWVNSGRFTYSYASCSQMKFVLPDTTTMTVQNISGTDTADINDGIYRLVSLKPIPGPNALNGNVTVTETIDTSIATFQGKPYVQRHYDIAPSLNPGTSQAVVVLYYTQQDFDNFNTYVTTNNLNLPLLPSGGVDNGNVRITQLHGSFSTSPDPGNYDTSNSRLITPNVAWDAANQWWAITFSVDGFSGFFLSTANITLPLTLIDFKGALQEGHIRLHWITANEVATKEFVVQHGNNGSIFSDIGTVAAFSIESEKSYQFDDLNPYNGNNFYRLKMVDIDGQFSFSPIIKISSRENTTLLKIYPNPTSSVLSLQFTLVRAEKIPIEITDAVGKSVLKVTMEGNAGTIIIPLNIQNFSAGIYYLNVHLNEGVERISFIKK